MADQHAVLVTFPLSDDGWGSPADYAALEDLEDGLLAAIAAAGVGEFDGIGRGMGALDLFAYGPDADALFAVMEPLLRAFPGKAGGRAVKRYGPPGAREVRVAL